MREISLVVTNYLVFLLVLIALATMQTSLWLHVFGFSPAPYLWLTAVIYWTLNRSMPEAILMNYLSSYVFVTMSGMPLDLAFLLHLSIFAFIYSMKSRVLWSGPNSFMLACGVGALAMPIFTFLWSQIIEDRPIYDFHFFDMMIRCLLTSAASLPLYYLYIWIDLITQKTQAKESDHGVA